MSSVKSIILKGNFKEHQLIYRPCPNSEFSSGAWNICINTIDYKCNDPNFKSHCSISCNFVRGQKFSANQDSVLTYQLPLGLFLIETGEKSLQIGEIKFQIGTNIII